MLSVSTFFGDVAYTPPDAIFELTKAYKADPDTRKVNLGQGERAGLCAFVSRNHSIAMNVESNLAQLIRSKISNPPAFGARIVATVLGDGGLFSQWQRDLMTRSSRIAGMRKRLLDELTALGTPGEWEK
ncbi:hypothetical protein CBS63078_6751 [Aspergillus niger]|nr:hypothetical protein CBS115989_1328 [Aspergillus niger]KAI2857617.1 hypothetical protein CBS11232_2989 [Aspergillus niger]KAI2877829.1 hypothetical protein CBS115988_3487 [Aspergillus niger]KAI2889777.1 hypothetical protein CBS13152_5887 [Aspergillus niger]KAI2901084.1 hypothetical protein CBS63078_6751 [Aspergillus niger]